jgi:hypothetical protein
LDTLVLLADAPAGAAALLASPLILDLQALAVAGAGQEATRAAALVCLRKLGLASDFKAAS